MTGIRFGIREAKKAVITVERRRRWLELHLRRNLAEGGGVDSAGHYARELSALRKMTDVFVDVHGLADDAELKARVEHVRAKQDENFERFDGGDAAVDGDRE